ncbi:Ig-like domain-containing protein [Longispora albida]|uniref:Ig-like domain-containing protein n=1 Tax=Longispora albida TaxID=203523 RepID=UPI0003698DB0|nr:Ig-like domain-containing protein [Longispora albida]
MRTRFFRTAAFAAVAVAVAVPGQAFASDEDTYHYSADSLLAADIAHADSGTPAEDAPAAPQGFGAMSAGELSARAEFPAQFWYNAGSVSTGIHASSGNPAVTRYSAVVCGIHSAVTTPPPGGGIADLFTVPTTHTRADPCGPGGRRVGSSHITSGSETDPSKPDGNVLMAFPDKPVNGLWGIYAVAIGPNDTVSVLPAKVDAVLGLDRVAPTVGITAPAANFHATTSQVTLSFDAADQAGLSGIAKTECRNGGGEWKECVSGQPFTLSEGNGAKSIEVRVTDGAGNTATAVVNGDAELSAATTTTLTGASIVYGQSAALTAQVASPVGTPTGTVTLSNGLTTVGTATLEATGKAVFTVGGLAAGSHPLTVSYAGDASHTGSTGSYTQVVLKAGTSIDADGAHFRISQWTVYFSAKIVDGSGKPIAGATVNMSRNGIAYCSGVSNASGVATCATNRLTVELLTWVILGGKYEASYAGNANYTATADVSRRSWISFC